jgi:hypothetical protein
MGASVWWLVGGVLLVAVIPYTLIVVFPTNNKLLDPPSTTTPTGAAVAGPLGKIAHARSVMSLAAVLVFMLLM